MIRNKMLIIFLRLLNIILLNHSGMFNMMNCWFISNRKFMIRIVWKMFMNPITMRKLFFCFMMFWFWMIQVMLELILLPEMLGLIIILGMMIDRYFFLTMLWNVAMLVLSFYFCSCPIIFTNMPRPAPRPIIQAPVPLILTIVLF